MGGCSSRTSRWTGKTIKLGSWLREIDAAIAFDRAALFFGREGSLNLPSESRALGPCSPAELRRLALGERKRARGGMVRHGPLDGVQEQVMGFATEEEAALAYDGILLGLGGDRARLNFPDRSVAPVSASGLRAQLHARRKSKLTSVYRGVCEGPHGRWHAEIYSEGRHRLGEWREEVQAAEAYDRAALFFRGAAAPRNFPGRPLAPTAPADLRAEARAQTKATRTSRYHGVTWVESADGYSGWRAEIRRHGVLHTIGRFEDEVEAAIAYDRVARAFFVEAAKLNFPDEPLEATPLANFRREKRAQYKETTTSRYHGVSWAEHVAAWVAGIKVDHEHYFLGYHDDEDEAGRAYDRKRWELRGEGPYNFPDEVAALERRRARP